MAVTKTNLSVLAAVTTTQTSSNISVTDAYSADLYVSLVQVGTATTAATIQPQYSPDGGTTWYNTPLFTAGLAAATYYWLVSIPSDATHARIAFTQQAGGTSSTCTAQLSKITGI